MPVNECAGQARPDEGKGGREEGVIGAAKKRSKKGVNQAGCEREDISPCEKVRAAMGQRVSQKRGRGQTEISQTRAGPVVA